MGSSLKAWHSDPSTPGDKILIGAVIAESTCDAIFESVPKTLGCVKERYDLRSVLQYYTHCALDLGPP